MRVLSLSLKNIKSYKDEKIDFKEGITGISGLNGAGKSTILESIGFVLFDYLPYTQSDFIRKGEKTGEISINITGSDGIGYYINRKFGSSNSYYIIDENGTKIDGKEEVSDKLCRILGYRVYDIEQLKSLFENAIGVHQGTFISEFLESSGKRKAIFDPLLRIDEYNIAYKNMLVLKNLVSNRVIDMEKDMSRLEGKAEPLERICSEKESLKAEIAKSGEEKDKAKKLIEELKSEKERLDALEKEIKDISGRMMVLKNEVENNRSNLKSYSAQLQKCENAAQKVAENKDSFVRYNLRMEEKEGLEKRKGQRYELLLRLKPVEGRLEELRKRIVELEKSLKEIEKCEKDVKELKPLVDEQEELEKKKSSLISIIEAKNIEEEQLKNRMKPIMFSKGNKCPLMDVECKSVTDFSSYYNNEIKRIEDGRSALKAEALSIAERLKELKNPRLKHDVMCESIKNKEKLILDKQNASDEISKKESEQKGMIEALKEYENIDGSFDKIIEELKLLKPGHDEYQQNLKLAKAKEEWQKAIALVSGSLKNNEEKYAGLSKQYNERSASYNPDMHKKVRLLHDKAVSDYATIIARVEAGQKRIADIDSEIARIEGYLKNIAELKVKISVEKEYITFIDMARQMIREAGPEIIKVYIELISKEASRMYREIAGDNRIDIRWTQEYEIVLMEDGRERVFRQLSGGEQMTAALAVRLAILKILTNSDLVFLDEPTQNMDENRRQNLAHEIMRIKDFPQMIIISHDDTFNSNLENIIEIEKIDGNSKIRRRAKCLT